MSRQAQKVPHTPSCEASCSESRSSHGFGDSESYNREYIEPLGGNIDPKHRRTLVMKTPTERTPNRWKQHQNPGRRMSERRTSWSGSMLAATCLWREVAFVRRKRCPLVNKVRRNCFAEFAAVCSDRFVQKSSSEAFRRYLLISPCFWRRVHETTQHMLGEPKPFIADTLDPGRQHGHCKSLQQAFLCTARRSSLNTARHIRGRTGA